MDDTLDGLDYNMKALRAAMACLMLAGKRDDRDLNVLTLLAQETWLRGRDSVTYAMRDMIPAARMNQLSLQGALARLTQDRIVNRVRSGGGNASFVYSINLDRLVEVAAPHQSEFLSALPTAQIPQVRKRVRAMA